MMSAVMSIEMGNQSFFCRQLCWTETHGKKVGTSLDGIWRDDN